MYTVEARIAGTYTTVDWKNNLRPAKRAAHKLWFEKGWLYIRIISPTGKILQQFGEGYHRGKKEN